MRLKGRNEALPIILLPMMLMATLIASCSRSDDARPSRRDYNPADLALESPIMLPAEFQRGVNFAHIHRRGHGYGSSIAAAELDSLKQLGIRWVAIMPFGYQRSSTDDQVTGFPGNAGRTEFFKRTDPTLTDSNLTSEISQAHAIGVRVTLKPDIWSSDFWRGKEWHGSIRQTSAADHARWWNSYRLFIMHYAHIAEEEHADQYCIGTELVQMTGSYPDEWRSLVADVRRVYHGPLTYAAHWEHEFERITFWDVLDYIGITAYFPLDAPDSAGIEQLVAAWQPARQRIQLVASHYHRPVLFLEAGYPATVGSFRHPWEYKEKQVSEVSQARAYEALFRAFADAPWWKGVYFWKTFTDPHMSYEHGDGPSFSFRGRLAETVVRRWFLGSSAH